MGSSCALPPNVSSMSSDYVAGWRSFRSRWLQQRGAGETERSAFGLLSAPSLHYHPSLQALSLSIVWRGELGLLVKPTWLNAKHFFSPSLFKKDALRICGSSAPVGAHRHARAHGDTRRTQHRAWRETLLPESGRGERLDSERKH